MYLLLLSLMLQGHVQAPVETLRSGCSPDDSQIAVLSVEDPVHVVSALAGGELTCYKVAVRRDGQEIVGYVLGERLPAVAKFANDRDTLAASSLERQARAELTAKSAADEAAQKAASSKPALPADLPAYFENFSGRDLSGHTVSLGSLHGRVILVAFWSPRSAGSKQTLLSVSPLFDRFRKSGLAAIGISMDPNPEHMLNAVDDISLNWPQIGDRSGLAARYKVDRMRGDVLVLDASHRIVAAASSGIDLGRKVQELLGLR